MNQQVALIKEQYESLVPVFNERMRRLWAATEARALGRGGITQVARATGMARATVRAGLRELRAGPDSEASARSARVRRPGGGAQAADRTRSAADRGAAAAAGAGDEGGSDVPAAVDLSQRGALGAGIAAGGAAGERAHGEPTAA